LQHSAAHKNPASDKTHLTVVSIATKWFLPPRLGMAVAPKKWRIVDIHHALFGSFITISCARGS
jgi:hypothetical protein